MTHAQKTSDTLLCEAITLPQLFRKGKFSVPWHQRNYDWSKNNVNELLQDIHTELQTKKECYFLGLAILFAKGKNSWEINDGQQRMTTISLICARLMREPHLPHDKLREILFANDSAQRLDPPRDGKLNYKAIINNKDIGPSSKLAIAYREIDQYFDALSPAEITEYADFFLNKVQIACLFVKDSINPHLLFETINNRGKSVEPFDLLRNNLYSFFDKSADNRKEKVYSFIENVRVLLGRDKLAGDYARCYFQCKYGFLPRDTFYRAVSNRLHAEPKSDMYNIVKDFTNSGTIDLYRTIAQRDLDGEFVQHFVKCAGEESSTRALPIFLQELNTYSVTQPMIFALLMNCIKNKMNNADQIHQQIKMINAFVMRKAIISPKFEPSRYESKFAEFANKIWHTQKPTNQIVATFLKECDEGDNIMDDTNFKAKFEQLEMRNSATKAKVLLYSLNHYQHRLQSIEDRPVSNASCNLEFILPESDNHWGGWDGFKKHNPRDWVYKVGNLTLLGQSDRHIAVENATDGFLAKQKVFENSVVVLNHAVADCDGWSPVEIEKRQTELADLATEVWRF